MNILFPTSNQERQMSCVQYHTDKVVKPCNMKLHLDTNWDVQDPRSTLYMRGIVGHSVALRWLQDQFMFVESDGIKITY